MVKESGVFKLRHHHYNINIKEKWKNEQKANRFDDS